MDNNKAMLLMGSGTLGIIGALLLSAFPWVGLAVMVVAGLMVGMTLYNAKTKPKHEISHRMMIETPEKQHQDMMKFISGPEMTPELRALLKALRKANLPSKAPVFIGDHNETLMTVQDVLAELLTQAQAYKIPMSTLKQNIAGIHERIFENVKAACDAEPSELEAACIWLANRTLKDIQGEPSAKPASKVDSLMLELMDK
jgi:hypothetical protein